MATGYQIDFTDQNITRSFQLSPYTTNGPANPNSDTLDSKASSAATTLLLYGRGSPNYGERIQENQIHLLEHFASEQEPVRPVGGQLWLNRSVTPYQLEVYNTRKHLILTDPNPPANNQITYFSVAPANATEQAELLARFADGFRVRIFEDGTDAQEEHLITGGGAFLSGSNVTFQVAPGPIATRVGWYLGGWEPVLQNNAPLRGDIDANGWTVTGLTTPTAGSDATTKDYVDLEIATAIAGNNQLGELTDVTITAPANNDILVYNNGTGQWENQDGSGVFLKLTGGVLTGVLVMSGNNIQSVADPLFPQDAATKNYVDVAISSVSAGVPGGLNDLSDVILGVPLNGHVLVYNGSVWVNQPAATFISSNNILTTSGGSLIGQLFLSADPIASTEAATKNYVDTEIATAISASGDGVVDAGSFDPVTSILTLERTNALSDVLIDMTGAGGTSASIAHEIGNPNLDPTLADAPALAWERTMYTEGGYPFVTAERLFRELSVLLGAFAIPKEKVVFPSNGNNVINFTDSALPATITGTACNALMANGGPDYVVGFNRLGIFVNGQKWVGSEHGFLDMSGYSDGAPTYAVDINIAQGMETGLSSGVSNYTFRINVNSSGNQLITVDGANCFRFGNLLDEINAIADANYTDDLFSGGTPDTNYAFGVIIREGALTFMSSIPGTGSSISITDGGGGGTPLFQSIVGNAGTTGAVFIDYNDSQGDWETNAYTPTDYGYEEIGRPGRTSNFVRFIGTLPPSGAIVETLLDADPFATD